MMRQRTHRGVIVLMTLALMAVTTATWAQALPGGTLDPTIIPKYVTPLVIPPVMNNDGARNSYDIAVRQFQQQILPGGLWATLPGCIGENCSFPPTTVWSYGPAADPTPAVAPDPASQFNYPAYTVETKSNKPVDVTWINDLVAPDGSCLPHLLAVDQTVHWANPPMECKDGSTRTDCSGTSQELYTGPVPMVTHLHGAHVDPHSDGYPEAWWLPNCNDIPNTYATKGTLFDDVTGTNPGNLGFAEYSYRQDQPATTLWYHDHSLGMTRQNVYAGPAGFWLIRGGENDKVDNVRTRRRQWDGILPGPAPKLGDAVLALNVPGDPMRNKIREIPIVIQDRSFDTDGSLYYPANRAFFEGLGDGRLPGVPGNEDAGLQIPFAPDNDVLPTWNPEAFFNVMVVNGVSWPNLDVAPALYRFRLLNGCNSRFLNLALKIVDSPWPSLVGRELSFYQIGAEQGFLPKVAEVRTGFATALPGNGRIPRAANRTPAPSPDQALLLALAERADVLVDFRFLPNGTVVQMTNTAPDAPFGGFGDPPADPGTTGQVMEFTINRRLFKFRDLFSTPPWALRLNAEGSLGTAVNAGNPRNISLNELEAVDVLVCADPDTEDFAFPIVQVYDSSECLNGGIAVPFGPTEALLGTVTGSGATASGNPLEWTSVNEGVEKKVVVPGGPADGVSVWVTENPDLGATEEWAIYNFTADAHPIHLHLVRFEVLGRTLMDGVTPSPNGSVQAWETGYKDTVISYPGEITTLKAKFDVGGLYVWHCHILEHEDNEMMRPYFVGN